MRRTRHSIIKKLVTNITKRIFICAIVLGQFFCPLTGTAQDTPEGPEISEKFRPAIQVKVWGMEADFYTYGLAVSVPFIWIHDRVKVAPLAGFFWKDITESAFTEFEFAYGGKILYYFTPKTEFMQQPNHFFFGVGGMGTGYNSREERNHTGLIGGFEHFLDSNMKIGLEIQLGYDGQVNGALGAVIGLEWGYR